MTIFSGLTLAKSTGLTREMSERLVKAAGVCDEYDGGGYSFDARECAEAIRALQYKEGQ